MRQEASWSTYREYNFNVGQDDIQTMDSTKAREVAVYLDTNPNACVAVDKPVIVALGTVRVLPRTAAGRAPLRDGWYLQRAAPAARAAMPPQTLFCPSALVMAGWPVATTKIRSAPTFKGIEPAAVSLTLPDPA